MIWSGLLIYWAHQAYNIQIGDWQVFHFFPKSWFRALGMERQLAKGMAWHFNLMWAFMINGVLYMAFRVFTGQWRELFPGPQHVKGAWQVLLHDLGLRKEPLPDEKYNAAQRIAYSMIFVMGLLSTLSGWAIYKPVQINGLTTLLGGYESARLIHFMVTIGYLLFFLIHIAQVIKAGLQPFVAMLTGYEAKTIAPPAANPLSNATEGHD